jgi:hypothetical protein
VSAKCFQIVLFGIGHAISPATEENTDPFERNGANAGMMAFAF